MATFDPLRTLASRLGWPMMRGFLRALGASIVVNAIILAVLIGLLLIGALRKPTLPMEANIQIGVIVAVAWALPQALAVWIARLLTLRLLKPTVSYFAAMTIATFIMIEMLDG